MTTLHEKLSHKEYRDAFVSGHIRTGIAFQIRALRSQREWTQVDLAQRAGQKQSAISRLERGDSAPNVATLESLARAFGVALVVRFVPFSELERWASSLRPGALEVPSFDDEQRAEEQAEEQKENSVVLQGPAKWTGGEGHMDPGSQLGLPILRPVTLRATPPKQVQTDYQIAGTDTRMVANAK